MQTVDDELLEFLKEFCGFDTLREAEEFKNRYGHHFPFIESLRDDFVYVSLALDYEDEFFDAVDELSFYDPQEYTRRALVRTMFAMVDGIVSAMKQQVLLLEQRHWLELQPKEREKLCETYHSSVADNIKFTFRIYARSWKTLFEFDPPLDRNSEWTNFLETVEIRHRLMHPKAEEDLHVTDDEVAQVRRASEWFLQQVDHLSSLWWDSFVRFCRERNI